jgi:hypothetical protein
MAQPNRRNLTFSQPGTRIRTDADTEESAVENEVGRKIYEQTGEKDDP